MLRTRCEGIPQNGRKKTNRDLKNGLEGHLEESMQRVGRLDQVFKTLGHQLQGARFRAID